MKFKGFKFYHTMYPDNAAKGGSVIILKEFILHHQEMGYQIENIQTVSVSIKRFNTKLCEIIITAIYCPCYKERFRSMGYEPGSVRITPILFTLTA